MSALNANLIPATKELGFTFTRWTTQERFEITEVVNAFIFEVAITDVTGKTETTLYRRSTITAMFRKGEALVA